MNYFKLSFLFLCFCGSMSLHAQVQKIVLEWSDSSLAMNGDYSTQLQVIKGFGLDLNKPFFSIQRENKLKNGSVQILNLKFEQIPNQEGQKYTQLGVQFTADFEMEAKIVSDAGKPMLSIYGFGVRARNGSLERLLSFEIVVKEEANFSTKDYADNSILGTTSGKWYKIAVSRDGIYKLDKPFLTACGINTANLNPQHFHIFGNGEGVIAELNSVPFTDDLAQNAIQIVGENDGVFNDNDYVLFYGWGPHRWDPLAGGLYNQIRHPYSDSSYYFIYIGSDVAPLRISQAAVIDAPADTTITAYTYRDVYENDLVNLVSGGQRWYGEEFDVELTQNFNFSIPNIVNEPVRLQVSFASNARSSGNIFKIKKGATVLGQISMPFSSSYFQRGILQCNDSTPSSNLNLTIEIDRLNPNVVTNLDRILLHAKRNLVMVGNQMNFRVGSWSMTTGVAAYQISGASQSTFVWDISDKHQPMLMPKQFASGLLSFNTNVGYKEFVAGSGTAFFTPGFIETVSFQDLHGLAQADYLMVAHPDFLAQANRLADLHRANGLTVHVIQPQAIYNEFSSGMQDPAAIRRFVKMFYDRALANDPNTKPKYLLLFGDGTFDPKNRVANNNNFIVTYQATSSENLIEAMVVDDFFGMLDDNEAIGASDIMDIGVGRIISSTNLQAKQIVDKIEHYMKNGSDFYPVGSSCCMNTQTDKTFGDWRLQYLLMADNRDDGRFVEIDGEGQYSIAQQSNPEINFNKAYMDSYPKVVTAGGERFPAMVSAIDANIQRGVLVANYIGHGGEAGLADERVVSIDQINSWSNINALPLFVSATCEFTRFDDPERVSAGELVFLNPTGGAIAMLTTTRAVYIGINTTVGIELMERIFNRYPDGTAYEFGELSRRTKNAASASSSNKRSFTLIGDPALRLAMPRYKIVTDSINGQNPTVQMDTLRALSKARVKGHIEDYNGNILTTWNGTLTPTIFDKPKLQNTLAQDEESPQIQFEQQTSKIYRGQSSIVNGYFDFEFIVPKDIALNIDYGKISYYGHNGVFDAQGFDTSFYVGGIDPNGVQDVSGPEISLFMNQEGFVNGSITDENPVLLAKIQDENGVNTVGNGIGHDIVAILDGQTAQPYVLNDFYTANLNSYQAGEVRYQFKDLAPGKHTLALKVWDVNNNSNMAQIDFVVQQKETPTLQHVLNYPNPFTTRTEFMFEHNQSCSSLDVQVQIFTVAGRLVKTIQQEVPTAGFRISGIFWDGRDDFGDELARGTYLYRLSIQTPDGAFAEQTEKLVLLK